MSPRRSFSSLIKQRLACLIQQSSKLIISIINFLPTGICISGWWQLGASPLHSQVTLLAKKSGTNVKKAKLHTDVSDMIWKWGSKGVPVQARLERRGQKSFQRYKYTGGGLIKCVWPLSLLCLYIVGLFVLSFFFQKKKKCHNFYYFCLPFCIHWKYSYCTQLLVVKLTSLKNSIYLHFVRKKQVHNNGWGWKHVTALFLPCKYAQKLQQWEWKIFSSYLEVWNQNILIEKRSAY